MSEIDSGKSQQQEFENKILEERKARLDKFEVGRMYKIVQGRGDKATPKWGRFEGVDSKNYPNVLFFNAPAEIGCQLSISFDDLEMNHASIEAWSTDK